MYVSLLTVTEIQYRITHIQRSLCRCVKLDTKIDIITSNKDKKDLITQENQGKCVETAYKAYRYTEVSQ